VAALYPQFIYESILKTATNDSNFNFAVTTQPFPVFWIFKEREQAGNAFDFAFMVAIGLSLIPTVIVSFILKEREENLKHMQLISGMNKAGYWISNSIADIVKAYLPIFCIIVLTWIFNTNYPGVWILYLLFPPAIVMFAYSFTFFFTSETSAQIIIFAINFLISGVMAIMVITLQIIPQTEHLGNQLRWWFCLVPSYCVTHGIIFSSSSDLLIQAQPNFPENLWAWENLLGDAVCLGLHFFVGIIFVVLVEADLCECVRKLTIWSIPEPNSSLMLDDDVIAEEERVMNQVKPGPQQDNDQEANLLSPSSNYDVIRVSGLRKAYTTFFGKPFLAVERISFGLDYGECFALLGVNGAGKSTTFKSLTGDVLPTTGEITIAGFDIQRDFKEARKLIGYCP
jgi:ATP-binding cassette, subfamily A (ABC1), member 3